MCERDVTGVLAYTSPCHLYFKSVSGDVLDQEVDVTVNAWNWNTTPWRFLLPQGVSEAITRRDGLFKEHLTTAWSGSSSPIAWWKVLLPLHSGPVSSNAGCGSNGHMTKLWTHLFNSGRRSAT